jgi:hypothetical protein
MFRYIVAVAYEKIHSRIYFNRDAKMRKQSKSFLADLTVQWSSLRQVPITHDQLKVDSNDRDFLIYLSAFPARFHMKYPSLHKLGIAAKTQLTADRDEQWDKDLYLYTEKTEQEFHGLFTECLNGYVNGLKKLHDIRKDPTQYRSEEFHENLLNIVCYGCCLRPLIRSFALQRHITALCSRRGDTPNEENVLDGEDGDEDGGENDDDIEPLETDPGISSLVKPYRDWLRLITAEFDSANYLVQFFVAARGSRFKQITAKVLTPSYTSSEILPWKSLFKDFIPDEDDINNEQILNYLTTVKSSIDSSESWLKELKDAKSDVKKMGDLILAEGMMIQYLAEHAMETPARRTAHRSGNQRHVQKYNWWKQWLEKPSQKLNLLPDWPPVVADILSVCNSQSTLSLENLFTRLSTSHKFFSNLAKTDTDNDKGSSCRIHCETCLASLVFSNNTESIRTNNNYENVLSDISVSDGGLPYSYHGLKVGCYSPS